MSAKDITRGIITAVAVFTITLLIPGASFTFLGLTGFSAFAALAGTVAALGFIQRKLAPDPSFEQQDVKSVVTGESIEPRYVYGRAKTGGLLVHYEEWNDRNDPRIRSADRSARWIVVLGEGELTGLERLWVNGKEMPITPPLREDGSRYFVMGDLIQFDASLIQSYIDDASSDRTQYVQNGADTVSEVEVIRQHQDDLQNRKDAVEWLADGGAPRNIFYAQMFYGGEPPTDGSAPPEHSYLQPNNIMWAPNSAWTNSHRLYGKTYLVCKATQYGSRGQWIENGGSVGGAQVVQVLVRGIKVSTPNSSEPVWTENAAAIRHHWHTEILGASDDQIDQEAYRAAFQVCDERVVIPVVENTDNPIANRIREASLPNRDSTHPTTATAQRKIIDVWNRWYSGTGLFEGSRKDQLKYSINGIVTGSEIKRNPKSVEDAMDVAWAGSVIDTGSRLIFRPGANRSARLEVNEEDVVDTTPSVQVDGAIQQKATSLEVSLSSSARHNWDSHQIPRITDHVAVERENADFVQQRGDMRFVAYPQTAQRIAHIALRELSENRVVDLSVGMLAGVREGEPKFFGLLPSDVVTLNAPSVGFNGEQMTVTTIGDGLDGRLALNLIERPENLYDETFNYPIGFASGGVEYIPAPDPHDWLPTSFTVDSSLNRRFIFPAQVNGRDVQYRFESLGSESVRRFAYDRSNNIKTIVPFGDAPVAETAAGVYKITARYVVRSGAELLYPLSLWSDEYDGGAFFMDGAGLFMAGKFRSSTHRLPRLVFTIGVVATVADTFGELSYTQRGGETRRLQTFDRGTELGTEDPHLLQLWQFLGPLVGDTVPSVPTDVTGTVEFANLAGQRIDWTMRVAEQPSGDEAALQV